MTEDDGIIIDAWKCFPEAARRVEILERLRRSWGMVVRMPAIARSSWPIVLGVNELTVEVTDDTARRMLMNMKGTILRALEGLGYKADGDFTVKIAGTKKPEPEIKKKKALRKIIVDETRVKQYMERVGDTLPEDINRSLSNLMAYLERRAATKQGGKS